MGAHHEAYYILNAHIDRIAAILRDGRFAYTTQMQYKFENPVYNGIHFQFKNGVSLTSWGEDISITLNFMSNDTTSILINSECSLPTQIIDWGKNSENVTAIMGYINRELFAYAPPPQYTAPQYAPPAPGYQSQPAFCTRCGARIQPNNSFCVNCGNKLM